MLVEKMAVGPFAANCYFLQCEITKKGVVIDPGDEDLRILAKIREMGVEVLKIILTHGHPDHCAGAQALQEATGASLAMHKDDIDIANNELFRTMLGISKKYEIKPDELLEEGQKINVGSVELTVLNTPGHSPGSICLETSDALFSGDLLFAGGIGRSDLPGGNPKTLEESLRRIMQLDSGLKVYPGHGPVTSIGAESRGNIFLNGWI